MFDENDSCSQKCVGVGALVIDRLAVALGGSELVRKVSLAVDPGTVHCLVGNSGSGKTLTSLASVGLRPRGAQTAGTIALAGVEGNLLDLDQAGWTRVRGSMIGYVGQNALGCLHPAYTVGFQMLEAVRRHRRMAKSEATALVVDELAAVDLLDPEKVAASYPAQLSGGMCQRVALAMALCNRPKVLIADEPTTALDDDTQNHVLGLVRSRVEREGLSVLLITHDHAVVEQMADETTTISAGVSSTSSPVLRAAEVTVAKQPPESAAAPAVLEIVGVGKTYGRRRRFGGPAPTPVLSDVHIAAPAGSTIGLVGRSGAGKTTLARIVAGFLPPSAGTVRIDGRPITGPDRVGRVEKAGLVQYVFQDPFGSLNPRRSAIVQVAEPLVAAGTAADEATERAAALLADVGLTPAQIDRRPTALSGGQCQRVGIARALIRRPSVVILDEPVSALDWSIRDEILTILRELQAATGVLYLLIAHERPLIERMSDHIFVVADGVVRPLAEPSPHLSPTFNPERVPV